VIAVQGVRQKRDRETGGKSRAGIGICDPILEN